MQPHADAYTVHLTDRVKADLAAVPSLAPHFIRKLDTLADNPERGHPLTGALRRDRSLVLTRSAGGYRAVYRIFEAERAIVVFAIGPHATVYETAIRRYPPPSPTQ